MATPTYINFKLTSPNSFGSLHSFRSSFIKNAHNLASLGAVRIDTMMEQSGRLDPPATGFTTRGHILGNDTFLNGAFLCRMFLTHPGISMEKSEDNELVSE